MLSYCCSSLDFLLSHYTVLLSSFIFSFSCTSGCCCSLPCISQILQVQVISSQFFPSVTQNKKFLQWPRAFSSDDVCQGSHWLFQSLLCWRWWSLNPGLYLHCSWWWEVQTSHLSYKAWKVSNTLGSFSFLRSNLSLMCFALQIFFRRRRKTFLILSIVKSWSDLVCEIAACMLCSTSSTFSFTIEGMRFSLRFLIYRLERGSVCVCDCEREREKERGEILLSFRGLHSRSSMFR